MNIHDRLRSFWDQDAGTYDRSPSHAATDPVEAAAWRAALVRHLPPPPATVLDAGAGTGAISLLLAELGYSVTALDLSPQMLAQAERKATARELPLTTVVSPATEPPPGPFDAVVERHLLWTMPDPNAALSAWRRVAPSGRLALFEGIWARGGSWWSALDLAAKGLRWVSGAQHDHHAGYEPDLVASLPLAGVGSAEPLLTAVHRSGWRQVRIERLRDVEWARRMQSRGAIGWLEGRPQFAVIADA